MSEQGKAPSESAIDHNVYKVFPNDLNSKYTVFGGLVMSAAINRAWRSSMEIGVRVMAENSHARESRHVLSAYFTFVALGDDGAPESVPAVVPRTAYGVTKLNVNTCF